MPWAMTSSSSMIKTFVMQGNNGDWWDRGGRQVVTEW